MNIDKKNNLIMLSKEEALKMIENLSQHIIKADKIIGNYSLFTVPIVESEKYPSQLTFQIMGDKNE